MVDLVVVVTIDYIPPALVLCDTVNRHEPEMRAFVYVCGGLVPKDISSEYEWVTFLHIEQVVDVSEKLVFFSLTPFQASCYLKSVVCLHHLEEYCPESMLLLDSDCYVLSPFVDALAAQGESDVLLTPHSLPGSSPSYLASIGKAGVFNAGFIYLRGGENSRTFLAWWADCVSYECRLDLDAGFVYEQKWLDYSVSLFDFVGVLRNPGFNVGHWSLSDRTLELVSDNYFIGSDLIFILHMSGVERSAFSKYSLFDQSKRDDNGILSDLAKKYCDHRDQALAKCGVLHYRYNYYSDGAVIRDAHRRVVGSDPALFVDPFSERGLVIKECLSSKAEVYYRRSEDKLKVYRCLNGVIYCIKRSLSLFVKLVLLKR